MKLKSILAKLAYITTSTNLGKAIGVELNNDKIIKVIGEGGKKSRVCHLHTKDTDVIKITVHRDKVNTSVSGNKANVAGKVFLSFIETNNIHQKHYGDLRHFSIISEIFTDFDTGNSSIEVIGGEDSSTIKITTVYSQLVRVLEFDYLQLMELYYGKDYLTSQEHKQQLYINQLADKWKEHFDTLDLAWKKYLENYSTEVNRELTISPSHYDPRHLVLFGFNISSLLTFKAEDNITIDNYLSISDTKISMSKASLTRYLQDHKLDNSPVSEFINNTLNADGVTVHSCERNKYSFTLYYTLDDSVYSLKVSPREQLTE